MGMSDKDRANLLIDMLCDTPEYSDLGAFASEAEKHFTFERHNPTYVYVITVVRHGVMTGPTKVGISNNPYSRLSSLQTGHFEELKLFLSMLLPERDMAAEFERAVHDLFRKEKVMMRGEWIDRDPFQVFPYVMGLFCSALQYKAGFDLGASLALTSRSAFLPEGFFDALNAYYQAAEDNEGGGDA